MGNEYVEISVEVVATTPNAVLVNDGDNEVWIPNSQIHDDSEIFVGSAYVKGWLRIPEWLATKKGLV
jgi:hypothetical protein